MKDWRTQAFLLLFLLAVSTGMSRPLVVGGPVNGGLRYSAIALDLPPQEVHHWRFETPPGAEEWWKRNRQWASFGVMLFALAAVLFPRTVASIACAFLVFMAIMTKNLFFIMMGAIIVAAAVVIVDVRKGFWPGFRRQPESLDPELRREPTTRNAPPPGPTASTHLPATTSRSINEPNRLTQAHSSGHERYSTLQITRSDLNLTLQPWVPARAAASSECREKLRGRKVFVDYDFRARNIQQVARKVRETLSKRDTLLKGSESDAEVCVWIQGATEHGRVAFVVLAPFFSTSAMGGNCTFEELPDAVMITIVDVLDRADPGIPPP